MGNDHHNGSALDETSKLWLEERFNRLMDSNAALDQKIEDLKENVFSRLERHDDEIAKGRDDAERIKQEVARLKESEARIVGILGFAGWVVGIIVAVVAAVGAWLSSASGSGHH